MEPRVLLSVAERAMRQYLRMLAEGQTPWAYDWSKPENWRRLLPISGRDGRPQTGFGRFNLASYDTPDTRWLTMFDVRKLSGCVHKGHTAISVVLAGHTPHAYAYFNALEDTTVPAEKLWPAVDAWPDPGELPSFGLVHSTDELYGQGIEKRLHEFMSERYLLALRRTDLTGSALTPAQCVDFADRIVDSPWSLITAAKEAEVLYNSRS